MRLKEFLRGYQVDTANIQNVGNMAVLPLISPMEFSSRIGEVDEVALKRDAEYAVLQFENKSGKVGIIMQGAMIISKQAAQDRVVPRANIIAGKGETNIGVFCIQNTQAGHFDPEALAQERPEGEAPFRMLPPLLRTVAVVRSDQPHDASAYSRMWGDIQNYSKFSGAHLERAHLCDLYDKYAKDIEQFAAQFEPVPNQLGAIVLINGVVVAVDIMPTYYSWKVMWKTLIRDSYGMDALRCIKMGLNLYIYPKLDPAKVGKIEDLGPLIEESIAEVTKVLRQEWTKVDEETITQQLMNEISGVKLFGLDSPSHFGQAVLHDEHVVYMSLIPKSSEKKRVEEFKRRSQAYSNEGFQF